MPLYLDWNATAPPLDDVIRAMDDAARVAWGNPASIHAVGRAARAQVEDARAAVAELAGADPRDVVLTSGGTEANNLGLRSLVLLQERPVVATSRLEHPSVLRVVEALAREGKAELRWLSVTPGGQVELADLERALAGGAKVVALQSVNAETGVIQPVVEAAALVRRYGARLHVDAVQAWGKVDLPPFEADTRVLAAHKFRGPKGIGALVARPGLRLVPVLVGGSQERGVRPGTVDPVAAAGLAAAVRHARSGPARYAALAPLRDALERALVALVAGSSVNGTAPRVPHVTNVAFRGWNGPELVAALDLEGVCVSSGSACSAGTSEPSPVLHAMFGDARATSSLRLSLGETTAAAETAGALAAFERVLRRTP